MAHKPTARISEVGMGFLDRLRTNRRDVKIGIDTRDSPNWKLIEIIYQYFKQNDKSYKELLKVEHQSNA